MKILLVDDSKSARYALRLQLQRHGVEVETAESAESAFELLAEALPDAILMDHTMPGMNGFEAFEVIRGDPRTAHLPVVMCTSHEDPAFAEAAKRKGISDILPKSVAPEKLPDILSHLRREIASATPSKPPAPFRPAAIAQPAQPTEESSAQSRTPGQGRTEPETNESFEARVGAAIDTLFDAKMGHRLDQRIETHITNLLEHLRRDLTERLTAETQRLLDARLDEELPRIDARIDKSKTAHGSDQGVATQSQLQALEDHLTNKTLPDLVKIEIDAERSQIMDMVEQYVHDFSPGARQGARGDADRLASMESMIVNKAQDAVRREFNAEIELTRELNRKNLAAETDQINARMTRVYSAIFAATLLSVGAAATVYFLLA